MQPSPTICSDSAFQLVKADRYLFSILNSSMHMAWMRTVGGRLKGDYRNSNIVILFFWSQQKNKKVILKTAQRILDVRGKYISSTLADLYDPLAMPPDLLKAHRNLDSSVERAYGKKFKTDEDRVAFLFEKY